MGRWQAREQTSLALPTRQAASAVLFACRSYETVGGRTGRTERTKAPVARETARELRESDSEGLAGDRCGRHRRAGGRLPAGRSWNTCKQPQPYHIAALTRISGLAEQTREAAGDMLPFPQAQRPSPTTSPGCAQAMSGWRCLTAAPGTLVGGAVSSGSS